MSNSTLIQGREPPPPLVIPKTATAAQKGLSWERSPGWYGLSPNALKTFRENPVKYFFQYCAPKSSKWPNWGQTAPMAIGSAVDGLVKQALIKLWWGRNRRRDFRVKHNARSFSVFGTVRKQGRLKKVRTKAHTIMEGLQMTPIWDVLTAYNNVHRAVDGEAGFTRTMRTIDLESDIRRPTWVHEAPLNGKLDFLFVEEDEITEHGMHKGHAVAPGDIVKQRIIADLKVNGAFSPSGSSPTAGYCMRYDYDPYTGKIEEREPHERMSEHMESLHHEFAGQLATYALIEDGREQQVPEPYIGCDDRVMLVQVTFGRPSVKPKIRKTGKLKGTAREWKYREGRITFTLIDTTVSGEFKRTMLEEFRQLWAGFRAQTLVPDWLAVHGEHFLWMLQARRKLTDPATEEEM